MARKKSSRAKTNKKTTEAAERTAPRSLAIAQRGITTAQQFSALMSAIMSDLLEGSLMPAIGNATCNAGGKLLKMVELNQKYGQQQVDKGMRNLRLVENDDDKTTDNKTDQQQDQTSSPEKKKSA